MRALAVIPLLFVASCGGGPAENKASSVPASPSAGQWALTSRVTRFRKADQGRARIDTPLGTSATQSLCVAADGRLPTAIFSGDGFTCGYGNYYVRNGHASVTLNCSRPGLTGDIPMTIDGTFDGESISLHRNLRTILTTDGDVEIDADISGHRTGACTPAVTGESQNRR